MTRLREEPGQLSKLDPAQTIITLTGDIPWRVPDLAPPNSVAEAVMADARTERAPTWS